MATSSSKPKEVTISDVAQVLQNGYFLIAGTTSCDGSPIIFMLDGVQPEPSTDEQINSLIYISSLPTFSTDSNLHYCFILDRRKSSWTCVRKTIDLISTSFTRCVKEVVLLQPAGFIQKRWSSSEIIKLQSDYPTFQLVLMDDIEGLKKRFDADCLCEQLGGSVVPNTSSFIQQRMSIDSLSVNCTELEDRVKDLLLYDAQTDFDFPNDVASTEALINEHSETKNNLSDEIRNIKNQGEIILNCFKEEVKNLPAPQQMLHIQEVQRLTARLDDLEEAITDYWEKEETKLRECMRLREFHEEFKSLQQNLNKLTEALSNVRDFVMAADSASSNLKRLTSIDTESQALLSRALTVAKEWTPDASTTDEMTYNTVGPKCCELLRLHDLSTESLRYKQMLADRQVSLFNNVDAAKLWLSDAATHILETTDDTYFSDSNTVTEHLKQVECQLAVGKFLEIVNFHKFLETYNVALNEASKEVVEDTHIQVMELMARYEIRRSLLTEELARLTTPLKNIKSIKSKTRRSSFAFLKDKSVAETNSSNQSERKSVIADSFPAMSQLANSKQDNFNPLSNRNKPKRTDSIGGGSARKVNFQSDNQSLVSSTSFHSVDQRTDISYTSDGKSSPPSNHKSPDSGTGMFYVPQTQHSSTTTTSIEDNASNRSNGSSKDAEDISELITEYHDHSKLPSNTFKGRRQSLKAFKDMFKGSRKSRSKSVQLSNKPEIPNPSQQLFDRALTLEQEGSMAKMRSDLVQKLIASEEKYVEEVGHIIEYFMKPIAEAGDNVPTELYANQSLLFSNLEEIFDFHSRIFLHELREHANSPSLIGSVFKTRVVNLLKYKEFCSSRSRAEVLLRQFRDDVFLAERYRLQGHSTTLCSQLLIPARRIVNYSTFLQNMLDNLVDDEESQRDITTVLNSLSETIRYSKNLLHQVTIDGYHALMDFLLEADLSTHGALLHHGNVSVIHDKKSQKIKVTDFKGKLKPRHIFLFEKCIVLCKIQEDTDSKAASKPYSFVHAVDLNAGAIELPEKSNKFILRGNHESYLVEYAQSDQSSWVDNLKFALQNCDQPETLSPLPQSYPISVSTPKPKMERKASMCYLDEEDAILGEDPDVDLFELDDDMLILGHTKQKPKPAAQAEVNGNVSKRYVLTEDYDNDLLLGRGDVIECVSIRKEMMEDFDND